MILIIFSNHLVASSSFLLFLFPLSPTNKVGGNPLRAGILEMGKNCVKMGKKLELHTTVFSIAIRQIEEDHKAVVLKEKHAKSKVANLEASVEESCREKEAVKKKGEFGHATRSLRPPSNSH